MSTSAFHFCREGGTKSSAALSIGFMVVTGLVFGHVPFTALAQSGPVAEAPALPVNGERSSPADATPSATRAVQTPTLPLTLSSAWYDTIHYGVQAEGGFVLNPRRGGASLNFERLTTDLANVPLLNGLQVPVGRVIDPSQLEYNFGFSFEAISGSDGRNLHYAGLLERIIDARNQFVLRTANVTAHWAWLTPAEIDVKAGQYASPVGDEPYDAALSPFYSHSYIFNWGVPDFHTGLLSTVHVNPTLDIWAGVDSDVNTDLGYGLGDNNRSASGIFGIGLNGPVDGKMTILAISHFCSETPRLVSSTAKWDRRDVNDLVISYEFTES